MAVLYLAEVDFSSDEVYLKDLPSGFLFGSEGYKRAEDRSRSLCCRWLLYSHLKKEGFRTADERILYKRGEKPLLEKAPLQFSFSHSGSLSALLIDRSPCGVDVEAVRHLDADRLASRMLEEEDYRAFSLSEDKNRDFIALFTKMEARGKCLGTGLLRKRVSLAELSAVKTQKLSCNGEEYFLSYLSKEDPQIFLVGENIAFEK